MYSCSIAGTGPLAHGQDHHRIRIVSVVFLILRDGSQSSSPDPIFEDRGTCDQPVDFLSDSTGLVKDELRGRARCY